MSRLQEGLTRLLGRVEILARGADEQRRAAERALTMGHALEARAHARALLERVPGSVVGLALWAEAAEACWLDDEVVEALHELARQVPWRAEIWLRLGLAVADSAPEAARRALERAVGSSADPRTNRQALLALADLDLRHGAAARADRWLDRVAQHPGEPDAELALRRAECALLTGATELAGRQAASASPLGGNSRLRLVRARLARAAADQATASREAMAALLLEAVGAAELGVELASQLGPGAELELWRAVVDEVGGSSEPRWQAAFAVAEGRRADAREALVDASAAGDTAATATLLSLADRWRDMDALEALEQRCPEQLTVGARLLLEAQRSVDRGAPSAALTGLEQAMATEVGGWARSAAATLVSGWVASSDSALGSRWDLIATELRRGASTLEALDLLAPIEALVVARQQPLRVAVLGEFNAGKSTLINALLGTEVAPTAVRPTTACPHLVAWAPDCFARVVVPGRSDRVVSHQALRATLRQLADEGCRPERVNIYAPIERLKRIEILDTPGFNAIETSHSAEARRAIDQAHVALWLLDATAPLKESERRIIAEVSSAGVPIQVLVNKRDRVDEAKISTVMRYVNDGLQQADIHSIQPPVALSAKLAVQGRLGDAAALARSHYDDLEALLADHIVNRSDALRERALRRNGAQLAHSLLQRAHQLAETQAAAEQATAERQAGLEALAGHLRLQRAELTRQLTAALGPASEQLAADLRPLQQLTAGTASERDARHYACERARARLAAPMSAGIAEQALTPKVQPTPAVEVVRRLIDEPVAAMLVGAAATMAAAPPTAELLSAIVDAAIVLAAEALEQSLERRMAAPAGTALTIELSALHAALTPIRQ